MGLETLVLDQNFVKKEAGGILYIDYLDLQTRERRVKEHPLSLSHFLVSRGLTEERAAEIDTNLAAHRIRRSVRQIGAWWYMMVGLRSVDQKRCLPEDFIVNRGECYAPRTLPLTRDELATVEARLAAIGFSVTTGLYEVADNQRYKLLQDTHLRIRELTRVEINPLGQASFNRFAELVLKDDLLSAKFQLVKYESEPKFKTEEEAKQAAKELRAEFNHIPDYHEFGAVSSPRGVGMFRSPRWVVRCFAPIAISSEHATFGLSSKGLNKQPGLTSHKKYLDMAQQDEQRRWHEILYPASHSLQGQPLPPEQYSETLDALLDHIAAVDLEATRWIKGKPAPSGELVHAVLRSRKEKLIFIQQDYLPREEEIQDYKVIACEDELDLVQKLAEAANKYAFLSCHNGKEYDWKQLRKFNKPRSAREVRERLVMLTKNAKPEHLDVNAWTVDEQETANRINSLRKKHSIRGLVWTHKRLIDTAQYALKRHAFAGSATLEALADYEKLVGYTELEELFSTRTQESLARAAQYTTDDGENTWKVLVDFLPALLRESAATGRPLYRVSTSKSYTNIMVAKIKKVLAQGKHLHPFYTRTALQKLETDEKEAIGNFRNYQFADPQQALTSGRVYYNPLLLESLKGMFPSNHPIHNMVWGLGKESLRTRLICLQAAENYLTSMVLPIRKVMDELGVGLDSLVSRDDFDDTLMKLFRKLPDLRVAAELRLPWGFSLYDAYRAIFDTAQRIEVMPGLLQAGPFIVGDLGLEDYMLGSGNVALFCSKDGDETKRSMVATLDTGAMVHGMKFHKKDLENRKELLDAVREQRPPYLRRPGDTLKAIGAALQAAYQITLF